MTLLNSLKGLPILEIYMVAEGKLWVEVSSPEPVANHLLTRVLRTTFDSSTRVSAQTGERLYYHQPVDSSPWQEYLVIPSEWVVTRVVSYQPSQTNGPPEFQSIRIAYCEAQPLPEEAVKQLTYTVVSDQSTDNCNADRDAYREFLKTDASRRYVIRHRQNP